MATKNVVPRTGSEGEIGTSAKPWNKGHFNYLSVTGSDSTGIKFGGSLLADRLQGPFEVHTDTQPVTIRANNNSIELSAVVTEINGAVAIDGSSFAVENSSITALSSSTLIDLYSGGGFRAEADSNISFEGRNQFVVDVENDISLTTENSNLILQSNAAYPGPGYKIQLNGPQIQLTASGPVEVESSLFDVSGSSRFGNELTDTHIFTGSFHQTGSGATSVFTDHITIKRSPAATSTAFLTVGVDTPAITTDPANAGFLYLGGPSSYGGHLRFLHNDTTSSAMIYNAGPDLLVASSASFEFEAGAAIDGSPIQSSGNDFRFRHTNQASGSFEVDVHGNVEIDAQEDILINAGTGMVLDGGAGLFSIDLRSPTYIGRSFDNKDLQVWGNITGSGHVSASAFYGDGTGITGITAAWDGQFNGDAGITGSLEVTQNITASTIQITADGNPAIVDANGNVKMQFDSDEIYFYADDPVEPALLVATNIVDVSPNADLDFRVGGSSNKLFVDVSEDLVVANGDLDISGSSEFGNLSTDTHQFTGSFLLCNPDETNAGLSIEAGNTNHVTLKAKDLTNGRINIGNGLNTTLLISSNFAGSMYPAAGSNYDFGNSSKPWGSVGTKRLTSSLGIEVGGQVHGSGNDIGEETSVNFSIDWDDGMTQEIILSGSTATTLTASFDNVRPYATYQLIHKIGKDSMAIYFADPIYWPGGTRPTLSTTSGSIDVLTFTTDGNSNLYGVAQYAFSASVG
tara:strand:- start:9289 stop:11517 length:2229 start_codon:yes stop_codon:yes gene_type:complete